MKKCIHRSFTMLLVIALFVSIIPFSAMAAPAMPNTYISRVVYKITDGWNGPTIYTETKTYTSSSGLIAYNNQSIDYVVPAAIWENYNTAVYTANITINHATANRGQYWLGGNLRNWYDITPGTSQEVQINVLSQDLGKASESSFQGFYLYRDPTNFQSSEQKCVQLKFSKENLAPAPTGVGYENLTHRITGLNSNMLFRHKTFETWTDWYYINVSNGSYNLYPNLLSSRSTQVEVKYSSPASKSWTYTVPALPQAPQGLYIDWNNGQPALFGLDSTRYYAISNTTNFAAYSYTGPGSSAVYLDSSLQAGNSIYVRSAANANPSSIASDYVKLTVPSKPVVVPPATQYDNTQHHLFGLNADMDLRITLGDSWSDWLQIPSNGMYFNAYQFLSTSTSTQMQVRYRNTPSAVQTITVPALSAAPAGMEFEWLDGVGLVLWGFDSGKHYNLWYDSFFDDWYAINATSYGLDVSSLGLQSGDSFYVRYAPNGSSAQSACVELVVPSMAAQAASAEVATDGETAEKQRASVPAIEAIRNETAFAANGEEFVLDEAVSSDVTADNEVQGSSSRAVAAELEDEQLFGDLAEYSAESDIEPIIISAEVFVK